MNQGFNQNEFENFLKEHAEEHRLFPSDNVWKNIYQHVHLKGKFQLVILILLIVSTAITFTIQNNHRGYSNKRIANQLIAFHPHLYDWDHYFITGQNLNELLNEHDANFLSLDNSNKPVKVLPEEANFYTQTIPNNSISSSEISNTISVKEIISKELPTPNNYFSHLDKVKLPPTEEINTSSVVKNSEEKLSALPVMAISEKEELDELDVLKPFKKGRRDRISWQLSAMPTASFRRLSDASKHEGRMLNNFPFVPSNPEELVRHTPAIGLELGVHMLYQLNDRFRLKTGLQMNYSKYEINAYSTGTVEPVRIELAGIPSRSYLSYSNLRNFGGEKAESITNQYFQLAVPVGMEFTFFKRDKVELTAAGTIQPNYLLNANSYLITADFKNYAKAPDLIRKFNASTSGEVFVSYSTGSTRWQVGPVVRYQLKSSFIKEYPIREHIVEYGFKIAVSNIIP